MNKKLFFVGVILAASGIISPPLALLGGLVYGLALTHPFHVESKSLSRFLPQVSVVALGFGMNLREVIRAGRSGFLYTALGIAAAMLFGLGLGYLMRVKKKAGFLRYFLHPQLCGSFAPSFDRPRASHDTNAVRPLVRARDSRHQFRLDYSGRNDGQKYISPADGIKRVRRLAFLSDTFGRLSPCHIDYQRVPESVFYWRPAGNCSRFLVLAISALSRFKASLNWNFRAFSGVRVG
jgi:hypothetical protein